MVWLMMGAAVCVVISSAAATPWALPQPLPHVVRLAVENTSDLFLWWGYGIRSRPDEDAANGSRHRRMRITPVVRRLRSAGDKLWHGTGATAAWVRNHAAEIMVLIVFLGEGADSDIDTQTNQPAIPTRGPP
jgi:hypothetical protein